MVCSSNPVFENIHLSCNGPRQIQQSKAPPLNNNRLLKSLLGNSEKLSWSQTKVMKMSKSGTSWDHQRKSWDNQRQQQFATLLDDEEFDPPNDEIMQADNKEKGNDNEEVSIIGYNNKKTDSTSLYSPISQHTSLYNTMPHGGILRNSVIKNTVDASNVIKFQSIPYKTAPSSIPFVQIPYSAMPQGGLRKTIDSTNTIKYQTIPYKNSTSEIQKIQYVYNNGYSNNNFGPKKVHFQETGNVTKVENKSTNEYSYNKIENVNSEPVYNKSNTEIANKASKMQLAEHLRAKRIGEAIEAAIASKSISPYQTNNISEDQNSEKSNWSISQKLDHNTHKIMPLTLKLKKDTKKTGKKRTKRCDKNSICTINCMGCKNSHTDAAKKKQSNPKKSKNKNLDFLDLPKDGNYLIIRKVIEECPMCYTPLNIRKCALNITLLTYTYYCDCGLTIFHIPETPKNIPHPIKIIETQD